MSHSFEPTYWSSQWENLWEIKICPVDWIVLHTRYTAIIHQLTSILTTPKIVLDLGFTAHQTSHLKACIVSQMISYLDALKSPNKILKVAYNKYF